MPRKAKPSLAGRLEKRSKCFSIFIHIGFGFSRS